MKSRSCLIFLLVDGRIRSLQNEMKNANHVKVLFPTVPNTLFTLKGLSHEIEFKHFDQLTML